jgi:glutamate synthase (NADPH) small chain
MSSKMLKFVSTEKAMPEKRKAEKRVADFDEIYDDFDAVEAETQSSRCSQCGVPFCQVNCPLHNNIPDWLMLTAEGRMQEAYELSSQTNNFPEICGRICPQDRLCEGSCVIEKGFESVTIGAVEKHITETAFAEGWVKPAAPRVERAESVGIIGAGPAGLAAAEMLRHRGYQVHIYDRYDRIGGLLMYGIPGFKLEKSIVERRGQLLIDGGVHFHLGVDIGGETSFADIRAKHDAILVATGVYKARDIAAPGSGLDGISPAIPRWIAFAPRFVKRPNRLAVFTAAIGRTCRGHSAKFKMPKKKVLFSNGCLHHRRFLVITRCVRFKPNAFTLASQMQPAVKYQK